MNINEIVSDSEIDIAWGNSDFGNITRREVIKSSLLKNACGYSTGHTANCILRELLLITTRNTLTKKGQQYLFAAYSNGNCL